MMGALPDHKQATVPRLAEQNLGRFAPHECPRNGQARMRRAGPRHGIVEDAVSRMRTGSRGGAIIRGLAVAMNDDQRSDATNRLLRS
jgi:hypothetical protein